MTRPTKSFQSDSINGGQNCLLQRLSKSKVRKKVRCALLSHSTNMSAASCTFQGSKVSCNLRHHDVGLKVSPSKSLFNRPIMLAPHLPELSQLFKCVVCQVSVQPAVASYFMGARVFITFSCTLFAMTKFSCRGYSASKTTHVFFIVTILHGDDAGAVFMLCGSTTISTAAINAGRVGSFGFRVLII